MAEWTICAFWPVLTLAKHAHGVLWCAEYAHHRLTVAVAPGGPLERRTVVGLEQRGPWLRVAEVPDLDTTRLGAAHYASFLVEQHQAVAVIVATPESEVVSW